MSAGPSRSARARALRDLATSYPDVRETTVCDRTSFRARNKAFMFMGSSSDTLDVMLKLRESLPDAARLAKDDPAHCRVGGHGWVTLTIEGRTPPPQLVRKWMDESYRLNVPRPRARAPRPRAGRKR
jgi:hypothetical protein